MLYLSKERPDNQQNVYIFTTMYLANGAVGMTQQFKETCHGVYKIKALYPYVYITPH